MRKDEDSFMEQASQIILIIVGLVIVLHQTTWDLGSILLLVIGSSMFVLGADWRWQR